jgi:flap endonuclease-1
MLKNLDITHDQLIAICMLIGTDYNKDGIKGIGPKNALKIVKKNDNDFDRIFKEVEWEKYFDIPWTEIFELVKNMPVTDDYNLEWNKPDNEKLMKLLVDDHEFSEKMVKDSLAKLEKDKGMKSQKGLDQFFK